MNYADKVYEVYREAKDKLDNVLSEGMVCNTIMILMKGNQKWIIKLNTYLEETF